MRRALLPGFLLLFFDSPAAFAYCSPLPRLICAEYSNSRAVVTAKLVQTQHFTPPDKEDWFVYTLETTKVLRGAIDKSFKVYEENSSGRAPFAWKKGESYLLFLNPGDEGTWWIYGCGNSKPLRDSDSVLRVIESMGNRRGGVVQGMVWVANSGKPMEGLTVEIRSPERSYKAIVNIEGKFAVHVRAGHYKVVAVRTGWSFKKDDLESLDDPADVQIVNGGCAQLVIRGDFNR